MTVYEPGFVAETLAWCNERRVEAGKPPLDRLPKGLRHDPLSCPCGEATGLYIDHGTYGRDRASCCHCLPDAVKTFVRQFDHGKLRQYDLRPLEDEDGEDGDEW